jgi:hypothetical protein
VLWASTYAQILFDYDRFSARLLPRYTGCFNSQARSMR